MSESVRMNRNTQTTPEDLADSASAASAPASASAAAASAVAVAIAPDSGVLAVFGDAPVPAPAELARENERLRRLLAEAHRFDPLTGLLAKDAFYAEAAAFIAQRPHDDLALYCFDICHFKLVNDLHGMEEGDRLLRAFAAALQACFCGEDGTLAARLGGDTFVACAPFRGIGDVERELAAVCDACPDKFNVSAVGGVYRMQDRSLPVALMCDRALMAMRAVKGSYFGRVAEYEPQLRDALVEERSVQDGIEAALQADQIEPFFQPKCNMNTGKIVGAEALVRWRHPERGIVPPGQFVPLLERSGLIRALDVRVWEKTAAWIAGLIAQGIRPVPVSVNVSRADIDGMDVAATLEDIVQRHGIDRSLLEVEITESAYVDRRSQIIEASDRLMASGFTVLMDDFGSGYSSLNMLKDINVNILKIDMRFLDRTDRKSRDIMESVVHMARWLDLPVVAEGVETDEQVEFLLDVGCVFAQGFRFYRPMEAESFAAILADGSQVDYASPDERGLAAGGSVFDLKDLLHEDVVSDRMLSNILGAVALYSFDGQALSVVRSNRAYRRLALAHVGDEAPIDVLSLVHPDDRAALVQAAGQVCLKHDDEGVEVIARRQVGERMRWFQLRLFHLYAMGEGNMLYGAVADVTERMEDVEALRMSERRFEIAMEATDLVVFELDLPSRTARYSRYVQEAFGLDATVANAPEGFIEQGSVDPASVDDFRAVYDDIYGGGERASTVVRAHMADGSIVWNRITLIAVCDAAGKATKAVGLVENVTREKEMEFTLGQQVLARLSDEHQSLLIRLIGPDTELGLVGRYLEPDFPLYFVSAQFVAMLGYDSYPDFFESTGGITRGVVDREDAARVEPVMIAREPGESYTVRYHLIRKDGSRIYVEDRGSIVQTPDGRTASLSVNTIVPEGVPEGGQAAAL